MSRWGFYDPTITTFNCEKPYRMRVGIEVADTSVTDECSHFRVNESLMASTEMRDSRDHAEIITTLQPGTSVRLESKIGRYLSVCSLNDTKVSGYVHEEDAFFERIK